jgi:hypothetical protein
MHLIDIVLQILNLFILNGNLLLKIVQLSLPNLNIMFLTVHFLQKFSTLFLGFSDILPINFGVLLKLSLFLIYRLFLILL